MKHICGLLIFVLFIKTGYAQESKTWSYNDIPVVYNLDSLEKLAVVEKSNPDKLYFILVTLEKSRAGYFSKKFGNDFNKIDSLTKIIGTNNVKSIFLVLKAKLLLANSTNKEMAAKTFKTVIELGEQLNDTTLLMYSYYSLMMLNINGNISEFLKVTGSNQSFAKQYFNKIILLGSKSNNPIDQIVYYSSCVEYFLGVEFNNEKAFDAAKKGLLVVQNNPQYSYYKGVFLSSLATYYSNINNRAKAIEYYKECLKLPAVKQSTINIYYNYGVANSYTYLYQYDSAELYCNKVIEEIKLNDTSNLNILGYCYNLLSYVKYNTKDYKASIEIKYIADSVDGIRITREKENQFIELENKYELEKKEQANYILQKEKAQYKLISIIIFSTLILIVGLLIAFYKQNGKLKKLVVFRDKIHSIISHDLRSPFAALQDLNEQASFYLKTNDIKQFNKLANNIDSTSIKISNLLNNLLQWAIANNKKGMQSNVNLNVASVINNVIQLYSNTIENKKIVVNKPVNSNIEINASKNVIELIMRNWLDNILKYSNATEVNFIVENNKNATTIIIQDNGNINEEVATIIKNQLAQSSTIKMENDTGLGLGLIAYFAKENKFTIHFERANGSNIFCLKMINNNGENLK